MCIPLLQELKAVVGGQKIQILFTPKVAFGSQQMKVKVNDVEKTLDENNQLTVVESRQPVAVVQCDQIKCEILSQKHGVYVSMDSERVAVEVCENIFCCSLPSICNVGFIQ